MTNLTVFDHNGNQLQLIETGKSGGEGRIFLIQENKWKGSAYGVPFHLDDSGSAYRDPQMALLGSANRDLFLKSFTTKKSQHPNLAQVHQYHTRIFLSYEQPSPHCCKIC